VSLLAPQRRVYHRWRMILPIYDGRECPTCGALICNREGRRLHREWHMRREAWEEWVVSTIIQIAEFAGMEVEESTGGEEHGRVDLAAELPGDDEEDDDD
jgi:hypothetical protein